MAIYHRKKIGKSETLCGLKIKGRVLVSNNLCQINCDKCDDEYYKIWG